MHPFYRALEDFAPRAVNQCQCLAAAITRVIIFDQTDDNKANIYRITYGYGRGWYLCLAGTLPSAVGAVIRFPGKSIESVEQLDPGPSL